MFISRKRYERDLMEARNEGWNKAMEQRNMDENFRHIHERIDRLTEMINKPVTVSGFGKDVTPGA